MEVKGMLRPETEASIIVLAGDIGKIPVVAEWAKGFKDKPVIFVLGNHEFWNEEYYEALELARELCKGTNVVLLHNEEFIIDNLRFIGATLWTDFCVQGVGKSVFAKIDAQRSIDDYKKIYIQEEGYRRPLLPDDTVKFHEEALKFVKQKLMEPFNGKTILVTHHAPTPQSIDPRHRTDPYQVSDDVLNPAFASNLEYLMGVGINMWFHGHIHASYDYEIEGTRIVCNPRGYDGIFPNPDFNPSLIIEV